jgi:hypothetical protein
MRPSLYLLKKQNGRTEVTMKTEVHVVVIDLDRSKRYPLNFICILPSNCHIVRKHSIFSSIFGNCSMEVARKLLQRALKRERDSEIRKELQERLKTLNRV